ncbi:cubilin-like [Cimex lectularius]|uniref:Cubilin n=1 Tax=Cimex lectularius TaxID=79782 RepID=A0A8I6S1X0_CIMLE|nr:cubilin-like [Cimex lectularius]
MGVLSADDKVTRDKTQTQATSVQLKQSFQTPQIAMLIRFGIFLAYVSCAIGTDQPTIFTKEGHVTILGGKDGNISFFTEGTGTFIINGNNLFNIITLTDEVKLQIMNVNSKEELDATYKLKESIERNSIKINYFAQFLTSGQNGTKVPFLTTKFMDELKRKTFTLDKKIFFLDSSFRRVDQALETNECQNNPCSHGGTCYDAYKRAQCVCPTNWKGQFCDVDVDECSAFNGTDLGCQNGATCVNTVGSYKCNCIDGWHGLHCLTREFDCSRTKSEELCGHGTCVQVGHDYSCICDQGWTVPYSPIGGSNMFLGCTEDINECNSTVLPCSHDPLVTCINTPGSFQCGSCPLGYVGNGHQCADIDECQTDNGGCSTDPFVQCINIRGSSTCLACPPGYSGDGRSCEYSKDLFRFENGSCHHLAYRSFNADLNTVVCQCPSGYVGTGMGVNGCVEDSSAVDGCSSMPCKNGGRCRPEPVGGNYTCFCKPQFSGKNCELKHTSCTTNPCQNGGTCEATNYFQSGFWCRCPAGYSGLFCEQINNDCLGTFNTPDGNFSWSLSFEDKQNKGTYKACSWSIQTDEYKAVKVTFSEFTFPGATPPCTDPLSEAIRLKVFDGMFRDSNVIGVYCGNTESPKTIISTENTMRFDVEGHILSSPTSFALTWTTVDRKCGYNMKVNTHGTISSPGFPGKYPKRSKCVWSLTAPRGKRIEFRFLHLDIGKNTSCDTVFIKISTGTGSSSIVLREICNSSSPGTIVTPEHKARIEFHPGTIDMGIGFELAYSVINGIVGCGDILTARSGFILPPKLSDDLFARQICEWQIQAPLGEKIKILFEKLSLAVTEICSDKLKVYDGPDTQSKLVGQWCRNEQPPPFISTSNTLTIVYQHKFYNSMGLFRIDYYIVCENTFTEKSGVIMSPNYPNGYPPNTNCYYTIERPPMTVIVVSILDMDIQFDESCGLDSLTIYDGNSDKYKVIGKYCGNNSVDTLTSTRNMVYLKFSADSDSLQGKGFYINYTTINVNCGGILTDQAGTIEIDKVLAEKECSWIIIAKPNHIIHLDWQYFVSLEIHGCSDNYIAIYDNVTAMGKRFCEEKPPPFTSSSNEVMITLFMSHVYSVEFKVLFTTENDLSCVRNFLASSGTIITPNYPAYYGPGLQCRWTIRVNERKQIRLNVKDFDVEFSHGCNRDYLEIRNGGTETSPVIGRFCGKTIPREIISHSNKLYLSFISDKTVGGNGLKILWDEGSTGCGGKMNSSSGSIISPNYPSPYDNNLNCFWKITVPIGNQIQLTIIDLDLEMLQNCVDYIEIFDGKNNQAPSLGQFCSKADIKTITSKSNTIFLAFHTDSLDTGTGFHLSYITICNRTITGFKGSIESPDFPLSNGNLHNCQWIIQAPLGNRIQITVSHFIMGRSNVPQNVWFNHFYDRACKLGYLEIKEQDKTGLVSQLLDKLCVSNTKPEITSNQDRVFINYKTSTFGISSAFRLDWEVYGCGGYFKNKVYGEFSSPGYPNNYNHSVVCEWYIEEPAGRLIVFSINDIHLETTSNCYHDHLDIYNGIDDTAPKLASLCHLLPNSKSYTISTSGNYAFVRFESDYSVTAKGFRAMFIARIGGCGGNHRGFSGQVYSLNYPQNYNANISCTYRLFVMESMSINLTFTDFSIMSDENCTNAYVEVRNEDKSFGHFCGNKLPPTIISSKMLIITHKTNHWTSKGFAATYTLICGGTLKPLDNLSKGTLSTKNIPHLESRRNCTWTIMSDDLSGKVTLMFTSLHLEPYPNSKSKAFIAIYSGYDTSVPPFRNITGNKIPLSIIVPSSIATIIYRYKYGTSFSLDYSHLNNACGVTLNSEEGTINSPNYPHNYPADVECKWNIKLSPGNKLFLKFNEFNITSSEYCNEDFLEIRENNLSGKKIGLFCGNTLPRNIQSNTSLWILFRSSVNGTGKGFSMDYLLVSGGVLEGPAGSIASPNYPSLHSISKNIFLWTISVSSGSVIRITIVDYSISQLYYDDCEESGGLMIYDGPNSESPVLKAICTIESPFTTRSNIAFIKMRNILPSKFFLSWEEIGKVSVNNDSCNSTIFITGNQGGNSTYNVTSPGYPNLYPHNLHCTWFIKTDIENHIVISFKKVDLWNVYVCHDIVKVFDVETNTELASICRHTDIVNVTGGRTVKITFDTDSYGNKKGFLAMAKVECGGSISEPDGIIKLPAVRGRAHFDCQWNITVKQGQTIKIEFRKFDYFSPSLSCNSSYVMLRNGGYPDSPYLGQGKYCGKQNPPVLETTSNRVKIYFKREADEEIEIYYEAISPNCKQDFYLSRQGLQSINISNPNKAYICTWVILTDSDDSLHFQLVKLTFDSNRNCENQYLEIREGGSERGHLIKKVCRKLLSFFNTEGNALFIKYFSDVPDSTANFSAIVSLSKCGGTLLGYYATIKSPGFPKSYEPNTKCEWIFRNDLDMGYIVMFDTFKIANEHKNCENTTSSDDTFIIMNVETGENSSYCGNVQHKHSFKTDSSDMNIVFIAKENKLNIKDLRFSFVVYRNQRKACGDFLQFKSGDISSPGYPNSINFHTCEWSITASPGKIVTVKIMDLDLPTSKNNYVSFYSRYNLLIAKLNGSQSNDTIVESPGNFMEIVLSCPRCRGYRGFSASYTTTKQELCSGTLADNNGSMVFYYPDLPVLDCKWTFPEVKGRTVTLVMSGNIEMVDGDCIKSTPQIQISLPSIHNYLYCVSAEQHSYRLVLPGVEMDIKVLGAQSNANATLNFTLNWNSNQCGSNGNLNDYSDVLLSPGYPNNYSPNLDCVWLYQINYRSVKKIKFNNFSLENDCNNDFLEIMSGEDYFETNLGKNKYCGTIVPADLIMGRYYVWFYFHSDSTNEFQGFNISIDTISNGCGGLHTSNQGVIMSPNYLKQYKNNTECEWVIHTHEGNHIEIKLKGRMQIEKSDNCTKDYLEFFDGVNHTWVSIAKKCGSDFGPTVYSTSNKMKILFRTNDIITGNGFLLDWQVICGGMFEAGKTLSHIYSPGYPDKYLGPLTCNYTISAEGKMIKGRFVDFQLEDEMQLECHFDYVEIITSSFSFKEIVTKKSKKYCGTTAPEEFQSFGSFTLTFVVNDYDDYKGFDLEYFVEDCGGEIKEPTEINYETTTSVPTNCSWYITAPKNRIVIISVGLNYINCFISALVIYDGGISNNNATVLKTLCRVGAYLPYRITSTSNEASINLYSLAPSKRTQFSFVVWFGYECGGTITLNKTERISFSIPKDDRAAFSCLWVVKAREGEKILMKVNSVSTTIPCSIELLVKDGGPDDEQIYFDCLLAELHFSSTGSKIAFEAFSFILSNASFSIDLEIHNSPCGQSVLTVTEDPEVLTSPNFPQPYPTNVHCLWKFYSSKSKISLHFDHVDMCEDEKCIDYLEVIDVYRFIPYKTRLSGKKNGFDFVARSGVNMRFASGGRVSQNRGFRLTYRTQSCTHNYTSNYGNIKEFNLLKCRLVIQPKETNRTISIYFQSVNLQFKNDCGSASLKIYDGLELTDNNLMSVICKRSLPNPIFSTGPSLTMDFVSKLEGEFEFTYTTTDKGRGCGGTLMGTRGVFTSPFYPSNPGQDVTCVWDIEGPYNSVVVLEFKKFDLGSMESCSYNFVEVYDVEKSGHKNKIMTYCAEDKPSTIKGNYAKMKVVFTSTLHNQGSGFFASFKSVIPPSVMKLSSALRNAKQSEETAVSV